MIEDLREKSKIKMQSYLVLDIYIPVAYNVIQQQMVDARLPVVTTLFLVHSEWFLTFVATG